MNQKIKFRLVWALLGIIASLDVIFQATGKRFIALPLSGGALIPLAFWLALSWTKEEDSREREAGRGS